MPHNRRVKVSVIVPCYRSSATLESLVEQLHSELATATEAYEVILVVDGSPDDTFAVARELERHRPDALRTVLLRRNYGQHNALLAGILRARYEVTVTMDDDLQHRPDQISRLLKPLQDPLVDLVYGIGETEEHGVFRSFSSRIVKLGLVMSGVPNAGVSGAFRAFRTELRAAFTNPADPFVSIDVVLSWATTAVQSVRVQMDRRPVGTSNYKVSTLLRHTWNMITGYGTLPLRLVLWIGLLASLFGFVVLVVILTLYWSGRIEVAGFTTLASLMLLFSGGMMLSIGILGEYLGRLHFRSMHQPTFLVRVDSRQAVSPPGLADAKADPDSVAAAVVRAPEQ
jgi:undecaprenyl-phosphate 4-deoxy-4-formamido-L-arabinose transferase